MDIQSDFKEYKAMTCMCQNFSETKHQCSQAMTKVAKEVFEKKMNMMTNKSNC